MLGNNYRIFVCAYDGTLKEFDPAPGRGVILTRPDGTKRRLTVDNSDVLSAAAV
jgi:hypothetical protein